MDQLLRTVVGECPPKDEERAEGGNESVEIDGIRMFYSPKRTLKGDGGRAILLNPALSDNIAFVDKTETIDGTVPATESCVVTAEIRSKDSTRHIIGGF